MEQMIELMRINNDRSLVLWVTPEGHKRFVVCSFYDETLPMGQRWQWGHYFEDLISAVEYAREV